MRKPNEKFDEVRTDKLKILYVISSLYFDFVGEYIIYIIKTNVLVR